MLICNGETNRQRFCSNFFLVVSSGMLVASSNVSPELFGAFTKRKNSRDLLQRYFRPRQVMSLRPLVDQFAIEVKTAARFGAQSDFQRSLTTGCRVACHLNPCFGTGNAFALTFSPKVKRA